MASKNKEFPLMPLTIKRMKDILHSNKDIPIYKNADCVLVGDIRALIDEVMETRTRVR